MVIHIITLTVVGANRTAILYTIPMVPGVREIGIIHTILMAHGAKEMEIQYTIQMVHGARETVTTSITQTDLYAKLTAIQYTAMIKGYLYAYSCCKFEHCPSS